MALATGVLAWDHLWGNEPGTNDPFPVDPGVFALGTGASLVCAAAVFLVVVPRTQRKPNTAPRRAMWLAGAAIALAPIATWLGVPLILAGGGIALGRLAPAAPIRSRWATAAVALGMIALALGLLATAFPTT